MQLTPIETVGLTKIVMFPHLSVKHGCSTRVGGVSMPPFDSLNMGFSVHDDPEAVWENRRRFARCLEADNLPPLLSMSHGREVAVVDHMPAAPVSFKRPQSATYAADAAITNVAGFPLTLTVADCVPVLFYDPVVGCIGIAHAGWRGTVAGIVRETVRAMQKAYGSTPKNVRVGIGPSIGPAAFWVGPEVIREFSQAFPNNPEIIDYSKSLEDGKALIDLWQANTAVALSAGVQRENIVVSGWCTSSNPDLFFSHRRDRGITGRMLAGIAL